MKIKVETMREYLQRIGVYDSDDKANTEADSRTQRNNRRPRENKQLENDVLDMLKEDPSISARKIFVTLQEQNHPAKLNYIKINTIVNKLRKKHNMPRATLRSRLKPYMNKWMTENNELTLEELTQKANEQFPELNITERNLYLIIRSVERENPLARYRRKPTRKK